MKSINLDADGWRGRIDDVVTDENVVRLADAYSRYLSSSWNLPQRIAIGFDTRKHSHRYAELFADVLSSQKISVLFSTKAIPSPVLSFAVQAHECLSGVMVAGRTAPPEYYGFLFKDSGGGPLSPEEMKKIETYLQPAIPTERMRSNVEQHDFLHGYVTHCVDLLDIPALHNYALDPLRSPSVMIDSMGGAGGTIIEDFLHQLGWRAQTVFGEPDETFYGRTPEVVEKNLGPLKYNTSVTDAIVGIATDGDAGRCGIVYDDGTWMSSQDTCLTLLWHLLVNKKCKGDIVTTPSFSEKVRLLSEQWKMPMRSAERGSGFAETMRKFDYMFGGDEGGGFCFRNHMPDYDGILSGLLFVELLAVTGKSLREIVKEIHTSIGKSDASK